MGGQKNWTVKKFLHSSKKQQKILAIDF